ncbi:hypothetical protein [Streptomyces sp. NPDC000134]|uniref:hypothetical protein n=1 Tax=Streptomyces sp. NPDC000134 TaxID=3364536 RepID=UPI003695FEC2
MARHATPRPPTVRRALAVLATTGAALGAGAAPAPALPPSASSASSASSDSPSAASREARPARLGDTDVGAGLRAAAGSLGHAAGPVAGLKPNPLAGTGVDPLDNGVGTEVADFPPLTSTALTGPVAQAESVAAVPVLGRAAGLLTTATRD